ncbi:MAG: hypothetical protein HY200_06780 [Nitrospirae bacterium]|nr:hypothetical protein [Nitrospirota bacterium]
MTLFRNQMGIELMMIGLFLLESCGGGGGGASSISVSKVVIFPKPTAVRKTDSIQLTATASDPAGNSISQPGLTWSLVSGPGSITSGGYYSAPSVIPPLNKDIYVTIKAASTADPSKSDQATFPVVTGSSITFSSQPIELTSSINAVGAPPSFGMAIFGQNIYLTWATTYETGDTHLWNLALDLDGNKVFPAIAPAYDVLTDILPYIGNSVSTDTFENPVIAVDNPDANGNPDIYLAWDDNSSSSVVFQIATVMLPHATLLGCESIPPCFVPYAVTSANQPSTLYIEVSSNSNQKNPAIAYNASGKLEMAWEEDFSTSFLNGIYVNYKEIGLGGTVSQSSSLVSSLVSPNLQKNPKIRTDHLSNVSVSWMDFGTSDFLVNFARRLSGQNTFGAPITVESSLSLQGKDTLALDLDYNGYPFLAWSNSTLTHSGMYYSKSSNFATFECFPAVQICQMPIGFQPSSRPSLKVDQFQGIGVNVNEFLNLVWEDSGNIYFDKFQAGSPTSSMLPSVAYGFNPVMDLDAAGRVYLIYSVSNGSSYSTYLLKGE